MVKIRQVQFDIAIFLDKQVFKLLANEDFSPIEPVHSHTEPVEVCVKFMLRKIQFEIQFNLIVFYQFHPKFLHPAPNQIFLRINGF